MRKSCKEFTWKNLAVIAGCGLVVLALIDTVIQGRNAGLGAGSVVSSQSVLAFLLVGIIVGMVCGIVMAFSYFMWKEKKLQENPDDLTLLLEELSREEALYLDEGSSFENDDKGDTLEPWERPTDWWKSEED